MLGDQLGQFLAHRAVLDGWSALDHAAGRQIENGSRIWSGLTAGTQQHALVHQCGERHPPAFTHGTDAVFIGNDHIGEKHLVEGGPACDLLDGAHLHAGAAHVHDEIGKPLVLGRVGVGACHQDTPVGDMRQGVPDLLAVDDPSIAIAYGAGTQPGQIRTGGGLREQLAENDLGGEDPGQEAIFLRLGAMGHDGGSGKANAQVKDIDRRQETAFFLVPDDLLHQ